MITAPVDIEAGERGKTYSAKIFLTDIKFRLHTSLLMLMVVTLPDKSVDFSNVFLFQSLLAVAGAIGIGFLKQK